MKENIKLFLKSLISNNAAIDGARKKPWYAAVIIFFIGIILSVIPTSVMELKNHADKNFDSTTFGLREASYEFANKIKETPDNIFYVAREGKTGSLVANETDINFTTTNNFVFRYVFNEHIQEKINEHVGANQSYVIFTENTVYISVLDPNSPDGNKPKARFACIDAYKKLERNDLRDLLKDGSTLTEKVNNTWDNFKGVIRKLYRQTRLKTTGVQLGISSAINVGVTLIMGFMVWVLTRGKNNPYRLFTVWQCFATGFWASFTPGLLTVGLGFLIKNFASMLFPLLLGVRVMWLTMKSLRPDGSGYAAN